MIPRSKFSDEPEEEELPPHEFPPEATNARPKRKSNGGGNGAGAPLQRPRGESVAALLERDIPKPARLCDPWATEGVNLIASRPKLGKTTLLRQKLAAAAAAEEFLDSRFTEPVHCAFLSLEEGQMIARHKFEVAKFPEAAQAGIEIFFEWPRAPDGIQLLEEYLTEKPECRYVAIDTLSKFRAVPDGKSNAFVEDYLAMSSIHDLGKRHRGVCIDIAHHVRKTKSEDPIDDISGSYGLTAACDSYAVLRHHGDGALMTIGGRLWSREEVEFKLVRAERHRWQMIGEHLGLSDEQLETLKRVKKEPYGLSGQQLADALGITNRSAWDRLDRLVEKGFVVKRSGKCYAK